MNKEHAFSIFWSEEDYCWVAIYGVFSTLSGLGDTPQAALEELLTAWALVGQDRGVTL